MAAARFLKRRGAHVTLSDKASEGKLEPQLARIRGMGIKTELGQHRMETFQNADLIVVSPGVSHTIAPLERARIKGIEVIGEMELAARFIEEPIVAVTGTNGKTTTTMLIGQMIAQSGLKVFVGGNIGNPLIEHADSDEKVDVVVAEVSSFQLDTITTFRPRVGVVLNVTEDHLDRYPDFNAYAAAKARIFENHHGSDTAVLNGNDPVCLTVSPNIESRKAFFHHQDDGTQIPGKIDTLGIIADDRITIYSGGKVTGKVSVPVLRFPGKHNRENVAAACLATLAIGGTFDGIQSALSRFTRLSHRLEPVALLDGIQYVDDSKATNVDAVVKALDSFTAPVILILGGRNKGNDFHPLEKPIKDHVKKLIVMGEAIGEIQSILGNLVDMETANSMQEAVEKASHAALPGDVVLLSPACASFDMFSNYAHRGEAFRQSIEQLKKINGTTGR